MTFVTASQNDTILVYCLAYSLFSFLKKVDYFFAALGLCCYEWAFSSCDEQVLLFFSMLRILLTVASLAAALRLWNTGSAAVVPRLNCSPVCGIFLDKVKPVSSVLVGGFLSTAPPGKPIFAFPSLLYFLIIFCPKSFSCPFLTFHLSVFQFCFCLFPLSISVISAASNRYVNQTCLFSHTTANLEQGQVPGGDPAAQQCCQGFWFFLFTAVPCLVLTLSLCLLQVAGAVPDITSRCGDV